VKNIGTVQGYPIVTGMVDVIVLVISSQDSATKIPTLETMTVGVLMGMDFKFLVQKKHSPVQKNYLSKLL